MYNYGALFDFLDHLRAIKLSEFDPAVCEFTAIEYIARWHPALSESKPSESVSRNTMRFCVKIEDDLVAACDVISVPDPLNGKDVSDIKKEYVEIFLDELEQIFEHSNTKPSLNIRGLNDLQQKDERFTLYEYVYDRQAGFRPIAPIHTWKKTAEELEAERREQKDSLEAEELLDDDLFI